MLTSYLILAFSILAEVIAASFVTATRGFTNLKPSLICLAGYSLSYWTFGFALININLGIAYATWTSVGLIVTTTVGYFYYKQKLTTVGYVSLVVIMISTITLNLWG